MRKNIETFQKSEKTKVLTLPKEHNGCFWYRIQQFVDTAKKLNLLETDYLDLSLADNDFTKVIKAMDVFYYRFIPGGTLNILKMFKSETNGDKVLVIDTDDDLFNPSPGGSMYESYGVKNVELTTGESLWEHGKRGFDIFENRKRLIDYEQSLALADIVTTTTMRLANNIRRYNKSVVVIPNAIDFSKFPVIDFKEKTKIRLLWAGGATHYEDLMEIREGLEILAKKYPQMVFAFCGQHFPAVTKNLPKDRVELHDWVLPDGHGYRLATLDADIAIAPVRNDVFNYSKSCIKWYEYSALKIPTVAANTPPYSDEIVDGKTGLLYSSVDEFVNKVSELAEDSIKAYAIAQNAYDWVKKNRSLDKITKEWASMIEELVKAKRNG